MLTSHELFDNSIIDCIVKDICFMAEYSWVNGYYPQYSDDINTSVFKCAVELKTTRAYIRATFWRIKKITIEEFASNHAGTKIAAYSLKFDNTLEENAPPYIISAPKPLTNYVKYKSPSELAWERFTAMVKEAKEAL
jgi:hypothetical protein